MKILEVNCEGLVLRRFDENDKCSEACFLADFKDFDQLENLRAALKTLKVPVNVQFIDYESVFA